ncbi:MAG: OmpA family protein [Acidobacteria bacterium]|nr:OmpA family protein [Acidobacteriota bacterium]
MQEQRTSFFGRAVLAGCLAAVLTAGCATTGTTTRTTERDKTKKGAAYGAAAGAVLGALLGEGGADEILAGAAIGAGIGAGVGAYMDRQEERLARIPGTTVERVGEDVLLVHFQSDLLFAVDSASLSGQSQTALGDLAGVLNEYPKTAIVVQGHTDATGSEEHNQSLSERRATSVQNYLIGRGVDPKRLMAIGYGEGHPVAGNETDQGRRLNRRVDILLKAKAT